MTEKDRQEIARTAMTLYNAVPDGVKISNYIAALMTLIVNEARNAVEEGRLLEQLEEATIDQLKSMFDILRKKIHKLN